MTAPLPTLLDDLAGEAETQGAPDGWGEVLAVVVIHAEGVRVMTYARALACTAPETLTAHLADLSGMLVGERRSKLQ